MLLFLIAGVGIQIDEALLLDLNLLHGLSAQWHNLLLSWWVFLMKVILGSLLLTILWMSVLERPLRLWKLLRSFVDLLVLLVSSFKNLTCLARLLSRRVSLLGFLFDNRTDDLVLSRSCLVLLVHLLLSGVGHAFVLTIFFTDTADVGFAGLLELTRLIEKIVARFQFFNLLQLTIAGSETDFYKRRIDIAGAIDVRIETRLVYRHLHLLVYLLWQSLNPLWLLLGFDILWYVIILNTSQWDRRVIHGAHLLHFPPWWFKRNLLLLLLLLQLLPVMRRGLFRLLFSYLSDDGRIIIAAHVGV